MRQALNWRLLLECPAEGVKLPQQLRREMQVLTVEQVRIFLRAALATHHGPALALAVATGMRPSEYIGLKWKDIDWARQTVSVVRSLRRLNGRWCFADTKRSRSRRSIKLQNWMVAVLRELHTATSCATPIRDSRPEATDLVLKTVSGHPINSDRLAKASSSFFEQASLPRIRLYDLRQHADFLIMPTTQVKELLGGPRPVSRVGIIRGLPGMPAACRQGDTELV